MRGKIKLGNQKAKLNTFMTVNENINLDYTYDSDGGKWIFNLESVNSAIFAAINQGKTIQMQLARKSIKSNYIKLPNRNIDRNAGYRYPNYIAVASPGDGNIPEDKKARIDITNQVKKGIKNIDLTTWVNNMIFYDSILTTRKLAGINNSALEDFFNNEIQVPIFTIQRFVLLINNVRYALTDKELKIVMYTNNRENYATNINTDTGNEDLIEVEVYSSE